MKTVMVVGCGSIGSRHIRNLLALDREVIACDTSQERRDFCKKLFKVKVCSDMSEGLEAGCDGVIIASPSCMHFEQTSRAVTSGKPVLVEKPVTTTLSDAISLERIIKKNNGILLNGFNMRFHPAIQMVKKMLDEQAIGKVYAMRAMAGYYLPDWHPEADYRMSYSAKKSLGGGSLLDGIHELEFIRFFFGDTQQVFCIGGKVSDLEIDTEDMVELTMKTASGIHLAVHMNYLNRTRQRDFQIIGEKGIVKWDSTIGKVELFDASLKCWKVYDMAFEYHINNTYLEEVRHFIALTSGKVKSLNDETEGLSTLALVEAAKLSMSTGRNILMKEFLQEQGIVG